MVTHVENRKASGWHKYLLSVAFAAIAAPLSIILHELGHLLTYRAFGFNDAVMRSSSVSLGNGELFWQYVRAGNFTAAAELYPVWQVALGAAAGPFVSILIVLACCLIAARRPHPFVISLGLFSPLRFIIGFVYIFFRIFGNPSGANFDEVNVARITGLPVVLLILIGASVLCGGIFWLVRSIPKGERLSAIFSSLFGGFIGFVIYFWLVAPILFS